MESVARISRTALSLYRQEAKTMGFFSEIASEARRNTRSAATSQLAAPEPEPAPPEPVPPQPEPAPAPEQPPEPSAHTPPPPEVKLAVEDAAPDDDARRKAHEAAEAKRKAEFDAKQAEKKAARQAALDRIAAMAAADLLAASVERVAADTERLTRRNMKEAVAGHIQGLCRKDAAFAMLVMDPAKSMVNCFQYINRQAQKYAEQEMKDNGVQRTGVYGLDVPDSLCFQWAEDYFKDENAKEDHNEDEKFVPKPYVPASTPRKTDKGKAGKKSAPAAKPKAAKPTNTDMEQISLM
ncbi:hypothetical protein D3Z48_07530 [Clostridiaceae bacterium]|nr:hypothetical protein [Clostridiaceae bacterium]